MAWKAFFRTWGSRAGRGEPTPAPPSALRAHLALGCAMGTACRGRGDLGPASVRQEPLKEADGHQHEMEEGGCPRGPWFWGQAEPPGPFPEGLPSNRPHTAACSVHEPLTLHLTA